MLVTIMNFPPVLSSEANHDPIKSTEDRGRVVYLTDSHSNSNTEDPLIRAVSVSLSNTQSLCSSTVPTDF